MHVSTKLYTISQIDPVSNDIYDIYFVPPMPN